MNTNRLALKITKILGIILWLSLISKLGAIESAQSFASRANLATFEENKGQIKYTDDKPAPEVKYVFKQGNLKIFLLRTGLVYQLEKYERDTNHTTLSLESASAGSRDLLMDTAPFRIHTYRMDMELIGANPNPEIIPEGKSEDYSNYYQPDLIQTHSYLKIIYKNIYPGIDWLVYFSDLDSNSNIEKKSDLRGEYSKLNIQNSNFLKYDFIVHPGADPSQIKLKYKNAEQIYLDHNGNLILRNRLGDIREDAPIAYQKSENVKVKFNLYDSLVSFETSQYDRNEELIIDPKLEWSTYYGGDANDFTIGLELNSNRSLYFYGYTVSTTSIAYNGFQNSFDSSGPNAFIVKFNNQGSRVWATYYGGSFIVTSGVLDFKDNIIVAGHSNNSASSYSFNGHQNNLSGSNDGFIVKFDSSGSRIWATVWNGATGKYDVEITIN